jgi:sugar porter (SP) family MFS transporter
VNTTESSPEIKEHYGGTKPERLTVLIFFCALTSALAGFLFGFDTVVISGAEQVIQKVWKLSAGLQGITVASALYGTIVGAMIGGWPSDRFGRKPTLLAIGLLFLVSAIWSGCAANDAQFIIARILGGLGIGMSTVVAPVYISEIAPPAHRGRMTGMYQFNIVFGIIVAYGSNAEILSHIHVDAWRWMFGVAAVPSFLYALFCIGIPESPRWLLGNKGDRQAGIKVLKLTKPDASPDELDAEADKIIAASSQKVSSGHFWTKRLRLPIMLAFLIAFFNQWSGINAVLYFAPRIFQWTGLGAKAAMLQSVGIGIANLLFTFVGLYLIDRLGRRMLLYIGSVGYITFLSLVAWAFFTHHYSIVPICIFGFVGAHAIGQGAVIWVYISEIFPPRQRAEGQALGCSTHWIMAAVISTLFPIVVGVLNPSQYGYIFAFFAFMMCLQLLWVGTMVVETKGVPLEDVQERLGIASLT